jgi:hypothetical protein
MEIQMYSLIPQELRMVAERGDIEPYVVGGVDVYRTKKAAQEDCAEIDITRLFPEELRVRQRLIIISPLFFSGRHYRVIDLRNEDEYLPQTTISELRDYLREQNIGLVGLLSKEVLESLDADSAYVLTPLVETELEELIRK